MENKRIGDDFINGINELVRNALAERGIKEGTTVYVLVDDERTGELRTVSVMEGIIHSIIPFGKKLRGFQTDRRCDPQRETAKQIVGDLAYNVTVRKSTSGWGYYSIEDFGKFIFLDRCQALEVCKNEYGGLTQDTIDKATAILDHMEEQEILTECWRGYLSDDDMVMHVNLRVPVDDGYELFADFQPSATSVWMDLELEFPYYRIEGDSRCRMDRTRPMDNAKAMVTGIYLTDAIRSHENGGVTDLSTVGVGGKIPISDILDKGKLYEYLVATQEQHVKYPEYAAELSAALDMVGNMREAERDIPERLLPLGALAGELGLLPITGGEDVAALVRSVYLLQRAGALDNSDLLLYPFSATPAGPWCNSLSWDAAEINGIKPEAFESVSSGCDGKYIEALSDFVERMGETYDTDMDTLLELAATVAWNVDHDTPREISTMRLMEQFSCTRVQAEEILDSFPEGLNFGNVLTEKEDVER
jgi:hypothetical protein